MKDEKGKIDLKRNYGFHNDIEHFTENYVSLKNAITSLIKKRKIK